MGVNTSGTNPAFLGKESRTVVMYWASPKTGNGLKLYNVKRSNMVLEIGSTGAGTAVDTQVHLVL